MSSPQKPFPSEIITMNNTPKNSEPRKKSVKSYATGVFVESTIGMVASIVSTHSRARKCFKSTLLMICITGFLYQCITYLLHVFEYPTVVDVDIQRPEEFNVPAYTFCSNNAMKRSVFCSMYPDRCYEPTKEFCSNFYSYCGNNKTLIPKKEFYEVEDTMSYEDVLKYGNNLDELLVMNKSDIDETPSGPYLRIKKQLSGAMICYSLHSVVENHGYPKKQSRAKYSFANAPADKLTFHLEEHEMFIPGNRPGVLFAIHSPYEAVNPFNKGIFMKPGRSYKIYITMTEEVLLEEPFETNCMNYEEIWEANNRSGPRIQKMCENKCLLDVSVKCFGCRLPFILYPSNDRMCNETDMEKQDCGDEDLIDFNKCITDCRDDCNVTKYTSEVMERYEVDYEESNHEDFINVITLEIFLEDSEIMTLRHSPKYINVEVFSAIGGFIGVWLGISFMDVIDVFASAFLVLRYGLKKYGKI